MRDHAGAPGWAIIIVGMVLVTVAILALFPPAAPEPTFGAPVGTAADVAFAP